ncbi:hypothetical protein FNV43_RR20636 [Rhamnella rubrinervis]|uniref:Peptidase A1 domain-containing protein n=1 Tax=Rhamnella rubrinervis TaxID=2594499 RepID=A0A8K0E1T2_9ROSA|nr:hypothetical protein FNV43_RR20636 [Rhamnella rubrinervis]
MAQKPFALYAIFSVFFTFSLFSTTSSHSPVPEASNSIATTLVLDVKASLKQAHQILSVDPHTLRPFEQEEHVQSVDPKNSSSSGSFSLLLYPTDALVNTQHKDYKSLVLSRLERDKVRVKYINAKLDLDLINNEKKSMIRQESVSTPISSGRSIGTGGYVSRIGVGNPVKEFYMIMDTGSDINWLQCKPCYDCYKQKDPVFDPILSSSYKQVTCRSQLCKMLQGPSCMVGSCPYKVLYGDGSYTKGDFVTETVSFGNSGALRNIVLGCGHTNRGLWDGAAGLVGLGGGPLSLTSQIKASSFSYCLVDLNSVQSSSLEFNSERPSDSVTTPLLKNSQDRTFYYVGITGISVGGKLLSIPQSIFQLEESGNGGVIVDSGTVITRLRTEAYESLRDEFKKQAQQLPSTSGEALFDTCYDLSEETTVEVPTVSFHFSSGKSLTLPGNNILVPLDSTGKFCFAFAPMSSSLSIIGSLQQQGMRVSFDLVNSVIGFSPNKC